MKDHSNSIFDALKLEIQKSGMNPPEISDVNKFIRFLDNGKSDNKDGWYILYINLDGTAGASFGNWKDIKQKWFYRSDEKNLTKDEQQKLNKQLDEVNQKFELEQKKMEESFQKSIGYMEKNKTRNTRTSVFKKEEH